MPDTVFLVQHAYEQADGSDEVKLIGIYATRADAEAAVDRARQQPGFRDRPDDFHVAEYRVGEDHWTEGYISWDEASQP